MTKNNKTIKTQEEESIVRGTGKRITNLFKIDKERQEKVIKQIKEYACADLDFYVLTIFSTVIISLGLVIDNGVVIIGGMLLAPLFWPILSLALAIIKGQVNSLEKAVFVLLKVVLLIFGISYIIGLLSPLDLLGTEILVRTEPTIFELLIALAAGFIGAFVTIYPGLSSHVAGVAIASAIVPPLATVGISFSHGRFELIGGGILLFLTNLIAIIIASTLAFVLMRFKEPSQEVNQERKKIAIIWTLGFLIIITIPLIFITADVVSSVKEKELAAEIFNAQMDEAMVTDINVKDEKQIKKVVATIRTENGLEESKLDKIVASLAKQFDKPVSLKVIIIPTKEIVVTSH